MNNDLISRSALKEKLTECGYDIADFGGLFFIIDKAPTVEFKGKKEIKKPYGWLYCSECGMVVEPQDNFCWFCGADMREADNEQ